MCIMTTTNFAQNGDMSVDLGSVHGTVAGRKHAVALLVTT